MVIPSLRARVRYERPGGRSHHDEERAHEELKYKEVWQEARECVEGEHSAQENHGYDEYPDPVHTV